MSSIIAKKRENQIEVGRNFVKIDDPFETTHGRKLVDDLIAKTTQLADSYRESLGITTPVSEIPRGRFADKNNWGLRYIINSVPGFEYWLDTAATATTVDTLYDPENATMSNGEKLGSHLSELMTNCADAKGIRSRAKILADLMSRDVVIDEKWLSLACGNAHPILNAAERSDASPRITLVDFSFDNLRFSQRVARERGMKSLIDKRLFRDLTYEKGFRKIQPLRQTFAPLKLRQRPIFGVGKLRKSYYDRIESCGFFEYLSPETAARFVKRSFELLAPGGRFIFNNISDQHPQRAFTEGVIQWPFIKFRGVDDMIEIIRMSGVELLDNKVEVFEASDYVCLMYELRKPR